MTTSMKMLLRPLAQIAARVFAAGLLIAAAPALAQTGTDAAVQTAQTEARMFAGHGAVAPGGSLWVALDLHIKQGWHTYWRTPGDSGLPTTIKWTLPPGVTAAPIQWPVPARIVVAGLMNFGYENHVTLLSELKIDPSVTPADAVIRADATWLVCSDVCIPEDGSFTIPVKIDPAAPQQNTQASAAIAAVRDQLPQAAPWPVKVTRSGNQLTFTAGPGLDGKVKSAAYFPYQDGLIVNAAPQTLHAADQKLSLSVAAEKDSEKITAGDGLLVVERAAADGGTETVGYTFESPIAWTGPAAGGSGTASMSLGVALLFALLGGLILNVMPCVLPVLVMKALSFIAQGSVNARERQRDALFYTLGVMVAFTALVGSLLALRAAGSAVGWGFQLQSPMFVAVLAYVMLALGLNLSGVFVIGRSVGVGQSLASQPGATGAFFTGLLAVVVATPCTVPFMGTAVGFAFTQPPVVSIAIFEALALGLALPYLILAFVPAAAKILPRPGLWMDRLRQVLAFPLYAAAAWLVWVLAQQVDPVGLAMAFGGVIAVAFAAWLMGVAQIASPRGRQLGFVFAGLAAIATIAVVTNLGSRAAAAPSIATANNGGAVSEPFSTARLKELQAAGRPVLVDFTAAWCLTCIVNERVALSQPAVADALKNRNVAYLKADWTNQSAEITDTLHGLGRDGVPLYVLYSGHGDSPKILPQLLTPAIVTDAINAL